MADGPKRVVPLKMNMKGLTGHAGEAAVVAALGQRGLWATGFSANMPGMDLLAYRRDGSQVAIAGEGEELHAHRR